MANTLITPSVIAKVGLAHLSNNLVMGRKVYREYKEEFVKVGDTISVRRPVRFTVTDGATRSNQDVTEGKFSLAINKRKHVSWNFNSQDLTLSVEEYTQRYIQPAAISLANQMDMDLCALYSQVWNWVGTPGQVIDSFKDFGKMPERLTLGAVSQEQRQAVLSPTDNWGLLGAQTGMFIQKPAEDAYRRGDLGMIGGVDTAEDQNIMTHTVGALGGTPLVNGGSQNVTYATAKDTNSQSLIIDGMTASVTGWGKAGDVFTIAGVYAVNPISKATLPHLQQFVVGADFNSSAGGAATITISPAIITSGAYQTVSAAPADNAPITWMGTAATGYAQNLAFHRNAFALVSVPLELPDGAVFKERFTKDNLSIRVVKDYDIDNDVDIIRLDVLYGVKAIYPDLATRASGSP